MPPRGSSAEQSAPPAADSTIFRQFVMRPREIGALSRSSPALARRMAEAVRWPTSGTVIEAGPGDGAITEELLAEKPDGASFLAVEVNPEFAAALQRKLPEVRVVLDDLLHLPRICAREGVSEVDVVVATLPWSLLPQKRQKALLRAILDTLSPTGQFLFYIYVQALPLWHLSSFARLLRERFGTIERGRVVWRNLPPAIIFDCRDLRD